MAMRICTVKAITDDPRGAYEAGDKVDIILVNYNPQFFERLDEYPEPREDDRPLPYTGTVASKHGARPPKETRTKPPRPVGTVFEDGEVRPQTSEDTKRAVAEAKARAAGREPVDVAAPPPSLPVPTSGDSE